jgi:hypothetical protein
VQECRPDCAGARGDLEFNQAARTHCPGSGNDLFDVIRAFHEESFVAIAGYLIDSITADRAGVQVFQYFKFIVEIQLLVQELNQLLETACIHNASHICCCERVCVEAQPTF